jgi:hypothetical protein
MCGLLTVGFSRFKLNIVSSIGGQFGLTAFLYQRMGDYCIGMLWFRIPKSHVAVEDRVRAAVITSKSSEAVRYFGDY